MITVRKIQLVIIDEDKESRSNKYKFIRDSQYAQYQGLNRCMGYLMSGYYANNMDVKSEGFKNHQKTITNSLEVFNGILFGQGIDSKSSITQKVKKDFSISLKNGLAKGERSVNNYKRTFPLMTRGRDLKFSYDENELDVLVKWVNKITFRCELGNHKNSLELQHTLHKIISGEYKVGQSSLEFNKKGKLIINLNIDMPETEKPKFLEGRTLGVDLGVAIPAYACLNDDTFKRDRFGTYEELGKVRDQFKARRRRVQQQLKLAKGGKGRKDKLSALEILSEKERNFAKTYNHMLSINIVKFAKDNQCEYIKLEEINSETMNKTLLGKWGYYELQKQIEYKAERVGIKVKYVNPAYTSQKCSKCGYTHKDNRKKQAKFECTECNFKINADHNAAINISRLDEYKINKVSIWLDEKHDKDLISEIVGANGSKKIEKDIIDKYKDRYSVLEELSKK